MASSVIVRHSLLRRMEPGLFIGMGCSLCLHHFSCWQFDVIPPSHTPTLIYISQMWPERPQDVERNSLPRLQWACVAQPKMKKSKVWLGLLFLMTGHLPHREHAWFECLKGAQKADCFTKQRRVLPAAAAQPSLPPSRDSFWPSITKSLAPSFFSLHTASLSPSWILQRKVYSEISEVHQHVYKDIEWSRV